MFTKSNTLSDVDKVRLDEIVFFNFISYLFSVNSNPTKVFDFVEVIGNLAKCDILVLGSVVSICMNQDRRYKATREEEVHLLARSNLSVRKIIQKLNISQRDYYNILNQETPDIQPRFNPKQYIEMIKFLDCLETIQPERIR